MSLKTKKTQRLGNKKLYLCLPFATPVKTSNWMTCYMKNNRLFNFGFPVSIAFSLVLFFLGCNSGEGNLKIDEGTISYEISYPGRPEGGMLDGVLPREMKMHFQKSRYVNTISAAGMFESKLIADCKDKTVTFTFNFGPKKIYATIPEAVADSLLNAQFSIPNLIDVRGMEEVAGYDCERTFAVFDQLEDGPDFEVKFTSDIQISNPNWCNQFKYLEAVMLEYEVKQYGLRLKLKAKEINSEPVNGNAVEISEDFKKVSIAEMIYEFEEVFKNFQ